MRNLSMELLPGVNDLKEGFLQISKLLKLSGKSYFFQMVNADRADNHWKPAYMIGSAIQHYATRFTDTVNHEREVEFETRITIKRENVRQLVLKGSMDFCEQVNDVINIYEFKYVDDDPETAQRKYSQAMVQCQTYAFMLNEMFAGKDEVELSSFFHMGTLKLTRPVSIVCHVVVVNNERIAFGETEFDPANANIIMTWINRKANTIAMAGHNYREHPNGSYTSLEKWDKENANPYYNSEEYFKQ